MMMDLIRDLERQGARLDFERQDLLVEAPEGVLTPEVKHQLGANKQDILKLLRQREWQTYLDNRPAPTDDPRTDLTEDSALWSRLLVLAFEDDPGPSGAWGALHGCRCMGARLVRRQSGYALRRGEIEETVYAMIRERYLLPLAGEIKALLRRLT